MVGEDGFEPPTTRLSAYRSPVDMPSWLVIVGLVLHDYLNLSYLPAVLLQRSLCRIPRCLALDQLSYSPVVLLERQVVFDTFCPFSVLCYKVIVLNRDHAIFMALDNLTVRTIRTSHRRVNKRPTCKSVLTQTTFFRYCQTLNKHMVFLFWR